VLRRHISRQAKRSEKAKAGKKRGMKQVGMVEVPQEAFLAVLNLDLAEEIVTSGARHPLCALPFLRHRCGYCDSCTAVGTPPLSTHATSMRCLAELELERRLLAPELETCFSAGGTPTLSPEPAALERLAGVSAVGRRGYGRGEIPEDSDAGASHAMLRSHGSCDSGLPRRAELPAAHLLDVLERVVHPTPSGVPFYHLRDADSTTSPSPHATDQGQRPSPDLECRLRRRGSSCGPEHFFVVTSSSETRGHASPTV